MSKKTVEVTLVEAQSYSVAGRKFEYGEPQLVDGDLADYLAENAMKSARVTSGRKTTRTDIPLFKFKLLADGEAEEEADGETATGTETNTDDKAAGEASTTSEVTGEDDKAPAKPRQRGAAKK